ncbi:hypothetical protein HDU82_001140, partial [Entophlyctis luteolus]
MSAVAAASPSQSPSQSLSEAESQALVRARLLEFAPALARDTDTCEYALTYFLPENANDLHKDALLDFLGPILADACPADQHPLFDSLCEQLAALFAPPTSALSSSSSVLLQNNSSNNSHARKLETLAALGLATSVASKTDLAHLQSKN